MADFNTLLAVKDLMTPNIETSFYEIKVSEAAKIMADKGISSIVLTDGEGKIAGIVTETDIVREVVAKSVDPASVAARDVMNPDIHSIPGDTSIFEARSRMTELKVKHMIVEDGGKPRGIVSASTLMGS